MLFSKRNYNLLTTLFRMILEPELKFSSGGALSAGPMARFSSLPSEVVLTFHHYIPDNWLIEPIKSIYDLDNIKLVDVEASVVHSEFELEYLLLEGHCFEAFTGNPPRGLQLTLGTDQDPVVVDTIVMANLGYLQLKSNPGRWFLNLREGRSAELYDIVAHEGTEAANGSIQVLIDSFQVTYKINNKKVVFRAAINIPANLDITFPGDKTSFPDWLT